jgi:predicted ATPase
MIAEMPAVGHDGRMQVPTSPYVRRIAVRADKLSDYEAEVPAVRSLVERPLELHPAVTFLVGENGSGKSTLVEALAIACDLNAEGGSRITKFSTRPSHSRLHRALVLERAEVRPVNGFFLRAESFFNVATAIEQGGEHARMEDVYERPLHDQSHGESFLALVLERFGPRGLYLLDEPEAALSLHGQLALMRRLHDLVRADAQFIVATHSPVLLGYPDARIYELGLGGIEQKHYEETDQYRLTRAFLEDRDRFLHHLFSDEE